jgi:hypothetical protein
MKQPLFTREAIIELSIAAAVYVVILGVIVTTVYLLAGVR